MKIEVPADHKIGLEVPRGGSNCAKCEYVSVDQENCSNSYFQKWNGGKKLPMDASRYCCDFFKSEAKEKPEPLGEQLKEQRKRK